MPAGKQWMIDFRVGELDKLFSAFGDPEIAVTAKPEWDAPETVQFGARELCTATSETFVILR